MKYTRMITKEMMAMREARRAKKKVNNTINNLSPLGDSDVLDPLDHHMGDTGADPVDRLE